MTADAEEPADLVEGEPNEEEEEVAAAEAEEAGKAIDEEPEEVRQG